ncbi:hypothetical protein BKA70DRAFT_1449589 [Coprinopsis sp. MPI-PUGE-AT-0042]|nr:hypothetical protein BKA70DRAFT_1449589 [Coprinopsis sp. MPI-PUGE-AT-0042]
MPIETTRMLIGRQTTIQTPPPILPSPPNAPSPIVIMGAMNASFVSDGILYGIHLVLFAMCCYILLTFQRRIQWFILAAVCAMFAISTADIGLSIKLSTTDLWALHQSRAIRNQQSSRGYSFVSSLLGYLGQTAADSMDRTRVLTADSTGRIYWVSVVAYPPVERRVKRIYRAIISTLVESAAIYSSCILVFLLWSKFAEASAYWVVPQTMMTRLVYLLRRSIILFTGYMPTLMIVQTGFSHRAYRCCCPNNHDSKNHNESVILDTVISGVRDLHHSPHRGDLEMGVDVDRHNREGRGDQP